MKHKIFPSIIIKSFLILLSFLLLISSCSSVDVVVNKRNVPKKMERIAIFPVKGLGRTNGSKLADLLMVDFLRQGYDIVERSQLKRVMKELRFSMSGFVDQRKAVEVGRMAGADAIIVGTAKMNRKDKTLNYLVLKFIDVKTSSLFVAVKLMEEMPIDMAAEEIPYAVRKKLDEVLSLRK